MASLNQWRAHFWSEVPQCTHENQELRRYLTANNSGVQLRLQCLRCGELTSQSASKANSPGWENLRAVDVAMRDNVQARIKRWVETKAMAAWDAGLAEYSQYLLSDAWRDRRAKVLNRANGICEGCGNASAEHVHHLHYRRIYREMLFDLVALCRPCHEQIHADEPSEFDDANQQEPQP